MNATAASDILHMGDARATIGLRVRRTIGHLKCSLVEWLAHVFGDVVKRATATEGGGPFIHMEDAQQMLCDDDCPIALRHDADSRHDWPGLHNRTNWRHHASLRIADLPTLAA